MATPGRTPQRRPARSGRRFVATGWLALWISISGCDQKRPSENSAPPASAEPAVLPPAQLDQVVEAFNKGIGLMDQYRPTEAIAAFEDVVRLAPAWTKGRLNLGIALLNAPGDEQIARAETELTLVLVAEPKNCHAHYSLGMLLRHLERIDEAKRAFQRVLELDPSDADAHYQLGVLLADEDPQAARAHLEETLRNIPHHESACYRLQILLSQSGETKRAQEMLARFQSLKSSGAGVAFGMKYGEMGRYADVVRGFDDSALYETDSPPIPYVDRAGAAGLARPSGGNAGFADDPAHASASFGPGVAVADVDGDGDLDIYIPGVGPTDDGTLAINTNGSFAAASRAGVDGRNGVGAYFGDPDADGDADLFLTCDGPNRLYLNDSGGHFEDATSASGVAGPPCLSIGAAFADADHDGDLDIFVASPASLESTAGAPGSIGKSSLWQNNGNGSFTDIAQDARLLANGTAAVSVAFLDFDEDRDLDLLLIDGRGRHSLYLNDRAGKYRDESAQLAELMQAGPALGVIVADLNQDGREDLLFLRGREPARLYLKVTRAGFAEDHAFAASARALGGSSSGLVADFDLDGDLDLALLGAEGRAKGAHHVLMNDGRGRFGAAHALGSTRAQPDARGAVAADFDGDGMLELVVARAGARPEFWRAPAPLHRSAIVAIPVEVSEGRLQKAEPDAVGARIELKTGQRLQVASIASSSGILSSPPPRAHFGLGARAKADYVRLSWPDAVIQGELEVAANPAWLISKVRRKPSSCPVLFSWDGERFAFVTDFLGVGGLGFFCAPNQYAPPDATEDVRIPGELVKPRLGRYELRIAEPLEEVSYVDHLSLICYDHPAAWEIYPDERFAAQPPFPTARPLAIARKIFPVAARDARGDDVRARVLTIDRRYAEPPLDSRFVGYADDHYLELDFGAQAEALDPNTRLTLFLHGWVEYTYSHVNFATHQAGIAMRPPAIEVRDSSGAWRVAIEDAGFPAGLPRMMTVDVSALPLRAALHADGRVRLRTNMAIFWDQVFLAAEISSPELRVHQLRPDVASLRALGYPREYSPDGSEPTIYDYQRADQGVPFKILSGDYTRFGDVRPLLEAVDDRFVVFGRGEEIALEFDADQLPELPSGWSRTLVLRADGYCKDMDLYTAEPDTVEPLPYHAMKNYPPSQPFPAAAERAEYLRVWNTRRIEER